ncbi:MAG: DUF2844 domain-containing protein [Candidatus Saccharibacteria bacterium]|nr:DUF2844 domain-containing protein [Rhodoferax sp.]
MRMLFGCVGFLMSVMIATDGLAALGQAPFSPAPAMASAPKPRLLAPNNAPTAAYTVHEAQLETGTLVREYASASGQVFAVTWRGPVLPDLSQWMGGYFGAFKQGADQLRLAGRRGAPINLVQEGLVVQSNGRMRNFFGHAYVPALVPPSIEINDVLQ